MKSVVDNLQEMAKEISGLLRTLLLEHSAIYEWNTPGRDILIIDPHGNFAYRALRPAGRQVQARLLEEYRRFNTLQKTLLREQPQDALQEHQEAETVLLRTIEQQHTWCETTEEALDRATKALRTQLDLFDNLFSPTPGAVYFVPDTNALIHNPALDQWVFDGAPTITLVLAPTVLEELDELKINHRNEAVREKAERVIRQIKELRRRGPLADGVTLVTGRSAVMALAVEPNMQHSLPWLDPSNKDDRFLATVLEVMRRHLRSAVLAVSRDINLQNKAEFARVPFVEPPEPMAGP